MLLYVFLFVDNLSNNSLSLFICLINFSNYSSDCFNSSNLSYIIPSNSREGSLSSSKIACIASQYPVMVVFSSAFRILIFFTITSINRISCRFCLINVFNFQSAQTDGVAIAFK